MEGLFKIILTALQIAVGLSVIYVWTFRYNNVVKEFTQFGLSDLVRKLVGTSKTVLAILLIAAVWFPSLVTIPSIIMALFMLAAQYYHIKMKNSFLKRLPSLILLILSTIIALFSRE